MRRLRLYDPSFYCEVTIRALDGWFAFDPNDIDIREQIYGLLAEAAQRTGVAIFIFHFMSNHYHGLYGYSSPAQFVDFLAHLHRGLARLGNQNLGRRGTFWSKPMMLPVSTDARSVARRFKYIMGQAVKAGICYYPGQFPGASAVDALLYGTPMIGRKVDRSRRCRDRSRLVGGAKDDAAYETRVQVPLSTPVCWAELSAEELRRLYQGIADEIAAGPPERQTAREQPAQVPGTCLITENTAVLPIPAAPELPPPGPTPSVPPTPQAVQPPKVHVPRREAEDGGPYRHGEVTPKTAEGQKKSRKVPVLLSVDRQAVAEYERRYKLAVQAYREAKQAWRAKSRRHKGAVRAAKIVLPPWMLLGTLPLFLRE